MRFLLIIAILTAHTLTSADTTIQTDWSGGPGVQGPVTDWGSYFNLGSLTDWLTTPGSILLAGSDICLLVDDTLDGAVSACAADVDGDGDMDLLAAARDGKKVYWWENMDGAGISWTKHLIEDFILTPHIITPSDIDNDGDIDVFGGASGSLDDDPSVIWWENLDGIGNNWQLNIIEQSDFLGARAAHSNDIDGDGDSDIAAASTWLNELAWWENVDGSGTSWIKHPISGGVDDAWWLFTVDLDGDLDIDIVLADKDPNAVLWFENIDGAGLVWTMHIIDDDTNDACSVHANDVDGDGDMDVLAAAYMAKSDSQKTGEDITWWENVDGSATVWIPHIIDSSVIHSRAVYSEDLDNDGDVDVISGAFYYNGYCWYENLNGTGLEWTERTLSGDYGHVTSVYAEDINGDGIMDVIGAGLGGEVIWWDLDVFVGSGFVESSVLYLGNDPGWGSIDWSCAIPSGTSVSFQVRASDDYGAMGVWSDTLTAPCSLVGILAENDSYFQYRTILQTSDPETTPYLEDITLIWNPVGIPEVECPGSEYALYGALSNPASGSTVLAFSIPEPCNVKLDIFDQVGRIVAIPADGSFSPGMHQVLLDGLLPGIYFCRMISGDFRACERFVLIE
jgi:hypothetical protein